MTRTATTTMAFAIFMAAGMPAANAQPAWAPTPSPTHRTEMTADHLLPDQNRVTAMIGATVYDNQNQDVGSIKDIVLGGDGRVAAVILNVGGTLGVGGRYVAAGIDDLKFTNQDSKPRFTVDMTKDQLKTAQTYSLGGPVEITGSSTPPPGQQR
jgi:hypothetical protein